jgi:hypothetical protein
MIKIIIIAILCNVVAFSQTPFDKMLPDGKNITTLKMENNPKYIVKNNDINIPFSYMVLKDNSFFIYDKNDSLIKIYQFNYLDKKWWSVDPLADHPDQIGLSPYSAFWQNPIKFTDPDGRCPDCPDETYVPLAEHVYTVDLKVGMTTSNGWEVVNVDRNDKTGYVGALYKGIFNGKEEFIYATKGTDMESIKDWGNNAQQLTGTSPQYKYSAKKAIQLSENPKYNGVSFTGHSLGGGMASANALSVDNGKAVTFNAAGLSNGTKIDLGIENEVAKINAYIVQGEIVDYLQSSIGLKAEGNVIYLPATYVNENPVVKNILSPFGAGAFFMLESATLLQRVENHSMESVIKSFNNYKK